MFGKGETEAMKTELRKSGIGSSEFEVSEATETVPDPELRETDPSGARNEEDEEPMLCNSESSLNGCVPFSLEFELFSVTFVFGLTDTTLSLHN